MRHYSLRTEKSYANWIRRFILFHGKRHPRELGASEIGAFLSDLAVARGVSASTQSQALNALVFLYRWVLGRDAPELDDLVRARRPRRLPVVLTADEVRAVLARLEGTHSLVAGLLYGSGLRLLECLRLRVKDLDFAVREVMVRDGKGRRDRVTPLPEALVPRLREHLGRVKALHDADLAAGLRGRRAPDGSGAQVSERGVRMGMAVGLPSASALRRSADRHGAPPSSTTMIYTHVLRLGGRGVRSPLDDVL